MGGSRDSEAAFPGPRLQLGGGLLFFMAVTKSLTDQLKQIKTYSSFRFQTLGTHHSQGNRGIAGDTGEEGMC